MRLREVAQRPSGSPPSSEVLQQLLSLNLLQVGVDVIATQCRSMLHHQAQHQSNYQRECNDRCSTCSCNLDPNVKHIPQTLPFRWTRLFLMEAVMDHLAESVEMEICTRPQNVMKAAIEAPQRPKFLAKIYKRQLDLVSYPQRYG